LIKGVNVAKTRYFIVLQRIGFKTVVFHMNRRSVIYRIGAMLITRAPTRPFNVLQYASYALPIVLE